MRCRGKEMGGQGPKRDTSLWKRPQQPVTSNRAEQGASLFVQPHSEEFEGTLSTLVNILRNVHIRSQQHISVSISPQKRADPSWVESGGAIHHEIFSFPLSVRFHATARDARIAGLKNWPLASPTSAIGPWHVNSDSVQTRVVSSLVRCTQ